MYLPVPAQNRSKRGTPKLTHLGYPENDRFWVKYGSQPGQALERYIQWLPSELANTGPEPAQNLSNPGYTLDLAPGPHI